MATNEQEDIDLSDDVEEVDTNDTSKDWQAEAKRLTERSIQNRERNRMLRQELNKMRAELDALKTKPTEDSASTNKESKESQDKNYSLIEKTFFKAHGIEHPDDQQLARDFAKRTGESIDTVLEDDIFKARLERTRTTRANSDATDVKTGRTGGATGKDSPDYWLAKLGPQDQVPEDLPRELRRQIVEKRTANSKSGKMFYND